VALRAVVVGGGIGGTVAARVQAGSRRQGAGYDSSGRQLADRRWIYEYDAQAEAATLIRPGKGLATEQAARTGAGRPRSR